MPTIPLILALLAFACFAAALALVAHATRKPKPRPFTRHISLIAASEREELPSPRLSFSSDPICPRCQRSCSPLAFECGRCGAVLDAAFVDAVATPDDEPPRAA